MVVVGTALGDGGDTDLWDDDDSTDLRDDGWYRSVV